MCMQDVDIARKTKTRVFATVAPLKIAGNPNRLAFRIVAAPGGFCSLGVLQASLGDGSGSTDINLALAGNSLGLSGILTQDTTLDNVGEILKGPLVLTSDGANVCWGLETYLDVAAHKLPS